MAPWTACRLVVATALVCAVALAATPPLAFPAVPPAGIEPVCEETASFNQGRLEETLSPSNGVTVTSGTPVTFSGRSLAPPTFMLASSPAGLSSPNIDTGPGSAVPFSQEVGSQTSFTYTYTSAVAANTPGTVYWQASFSTAYIEACAGFTPINWRTGIRTLRILPAPVEVSITGPDVFRGTHPTVAYQVDCSISCTGDTYYQAYVLQRGSSARRIPSLDLGPTPVSIAAGTGGSEPFTHHYSGSPLRTLDKILRTGSIVEIEISVKVTDASGNVTRAHKKDSLRS